MLGEFEKLDPASYAQYRALFPEIDRIPRTGRTTGDSFSVEQAIALKADLAIFGLEGHGPSPHDQATLARLQKAGVTVAFVDFRRDPIRNTPLSIALLGKLLDRRAQATAFNGYYTQELERVTKRLDGGKVSTVPAVFIESRVGLTEECCATMGDGMMGRFIDLAGGRNIAKDKVPGTHGVLSIEYLLTHQPDIYIGTAIGSPNGEGGNRIILGAGVTPQVARASLVHALNRPAIAQLRAVRAGRAHAVWHHFYSSPLNVAAVQAFAKWQHPERFADLDPDQTLRTLYERFQPVPLDGTYWISQQ
jgi:iron complex transport system substrate-binding protein